MGALRERWASTADHEVDLQDSEPGVKLRIDKVGVRGVRTRFPIRSPLGTFIYEVEVDAYVELPPEKRGAHMSRNIEAFAEAIFEARGEEHATIEAILANIARKLLEKHDYTRRAEVAVKTAYFPDAGPGRGITEPVDVRLKVVLSREGDEVRELSISLLGFTVCPCAQMTFSVREGTELHRSPSHTQRARLTVAITTRGAGAIPRIDELAELLREAFSAPVLSLLKRKDEYEVIRDAFRRPMFVEDVVRSAVELVRDYLTARGFPGDTFIRVEAESYESIHPYNAYAMREAYLGELGEEA